MKKISLICIYILIVVFVSVRGQSVFPIKLNSSWKIDKLINVISKKEKRSNGDETYRLFVNGDTTINSLLYFKLYKSGILYLDKPLSYENQYYGAVRETTSKIYYIARSKSSEQLLYDFNLKIGDTIKSDIAKGKVVIGIDTIDGGRKRFEISESMLHAMNAYIIEGIGSSGGLLNEPPVGHYMYNDSYLICYSEKDSITYNGLDPMENGCLRVPSRFPINPNGEWFIDLVSNCYPEIIEKGDDIFKYFIDRDTLINGIKYFRLLKSGVAYYDEPFFYDSIYVGALRDENNKFYYIDKKDTSEKILYDFDLKPGDTIKTEFGHGFPIKTIDILPDGRRCLGYHSDVCAGCCPMDEFVEGIGHWGGIMESPPCLHPCFFGYYLLCYKENDKLIYSNDFSGLFKQSCSERTFINNQDFTVGIFPNPVKDEITVEVNNSLPLSFIVIYDLEGREFLFKTLSFVNHSIRLHLSYLKKGIYFIRISSKSSTRIGKFIKE